MNPYLPIDKQNIDQDYKLSDNHLLHEQAGLLYNGTDEDGVDEWLGTKAQWKKYEELEREQMIEEEIDEIKHPNL